MYIVLKDIGVEALMIQSYVVTEEENGRLNTSKGVFNLLVEILDASVRGQEWRGNSYTLLEIIKVIQIQCMLQARRINGDRLHCQMLLQCQKRAKQAQACKTATCLRISDIFTYLFRYILNLSITY